MALALGFLVVASAAFVYFHHADAEAGAAPAIATVPNPAPTSPAAPTSMGQQIFAANCASCHQPNGRGLSGQFPPLAGSDIVLGLNGFGENHLARIVMNGLVGPLDKGGSHYGTMISWIDVLTDDQLAAVLTYIRQAWGNQAGPITPDAIAALRAEVSQHDEPWTIEELKKLPPSFGKPAK